MVLQSYYADGVLQNKAWKALLVLTINRDGNFFGYVWGIYPKIFNYNGEVGFGKWLAFCNYNCTTSRHFLRNPMKGEIAGNLNRIIAIFGKIYRFDIGNASCKVGPWKLGALQVLGVEVILHFCHLEFKTLY